MQEPFDLLTAQHNRMTETLWSVLFTPQFPRIPLIPADGKLNKLECVHEYSSIIQNVHGEYSQMSDTCLL